MSFIRGNVSLREAEPTASVLRERGEASSKIVEWVITAQATLVPGV